MKYKEPKKKLAYGRWLYGRALIERLRETTSWRQLSRAVKGHGDGPGWAQAAYEHPYMMTERDLKKLQQLAAALDGGDEKEPGGGMPDKRLTVDQRRAYKKLLRTLRDKHGWTTGEIAAALGYADSNGVLTALRSGGGMLSKLTRVQQIVNAVKAQERETADRDDDADLPDPEPEEDAREPERSGAAVDVLELPKGDVPARLKILADSLSGELILMGEGAPPFQRKGIDEAIAQLSDLMEFLGL